MILRDAKAIKLGTTTINKIYSGAYKVYDKNKTALEGYCIQNGEPTPDNPIEIETMKGRQVINVKGTDYVVDLKSKNLYNKDNTTYNNSYILQDGTIKAHNNWRISDYIPVTQGQNYTYQGLTAVGTNPYSAYYDKDKVFISSFKQATGTNTITIPNGVAYVRFSVNKSGGGDLDTFQLEEGSTPTTYEPYYDYELAGIDTYKDTIFTREGKWYLHKTILKYILNGSETWSVEGTGTENYYYKIATGKVVRSGYGLSTHYKRYNSIVLGNSYKGYSFQYATATNYQIRIRYGTEDTIENFKAWLANNNVTIYQVLGDNYTTEEEITAPGLIAQLNALYQAM